VYTRSASAAVSLVDASGVVTSAIMACRNVLDDGGAVLDVDARIDRPPKMRSDDEAHSNLRCMMDKKSIPRVPPRLEQLDEAESSSGNAWPTGLRTIGCLGCDAPFLSAGRHERLCAACRRRKP